VASLHPGIELAECRFVHDAAFPPLTAILADGAGSDTIVYGPAIPDWQRRDIAGQEVALICNGTELLDHPVVPLTWLANELSRTGIASRRASAVDPRRVRDIRGLKEHHRRGL
jgi:2-keto-4-pentenoate hydratase